MDPFALTRSLIDIESVTGREKAVGDFLLCITQGLRVLGKVPRDEAQLTAIVDLAMRALV